MVAAPLFTWASKYVASCDHRSPWTPESNRTVVTEHVPAATLCHPLACPKCTLRFRQNRPMSEDHEERPWGFYTVLDDASHHKVKRIEVRAGRRLSYQRHARRAEHWFILSGTAEITLDGISFRRGPGTAIDIPTGAAHRIANLAQDALIFIEIQHGDYFGEDDIERLEDDFGRVT